MATSKNSFLMIWLRDFCAAKVLESSEYFVYCELFKMHCWGKGSGQIAKGEFLEAPKLNLSQSLWQAMGEVLTSSTTSGDHKKFSIFPI